VSGGVLIITGPTACGKSELALELAERFGAEIVGADSRQIYRGLPIGSAAPPPEALARVRHHLVGFLDPRERYSAARFVRDAAAAIGDIAARGKRAIVCGGTGFYLRALCGDVELAGAADGALRERLAREARAHPPDALHDWLRALDPEAAGRLAPGDAYRVVRALEIALERRGGERCSIAETLPTLRRRAIPFLKVLLTPESRDHAARIERRVDAMLADGLVAEAERIGGDVPAAAAIGYPQALAFAIGWLSGGELRAALIRATRRYAKRQATWFRSELGIVPVTCSGASEALEPVLREVLGWSAAPLR
jgi:tRNA dimethylallyltransferase